MSKEIKKSELKTLIEGVLKTEIEKRKIESRLKQINESLDGEDDLCPDCNGSGEGSSDGSVCSTCGGSGEVEVGDEEFMEPDGDDREYPDGYDGTGDF